MDCYLGLDQSYTAFGVSVVYGEGSAGHATSMIGFPSAYFGSGIDRLNFLRAWLDGRVEQVSAEHTIRHVCMEGYNYGARNGREQSGELGLAVKQVLRAGLPRPVGYPTVVPPTLLKLYVTGRGDASKADMLDGVKVRWDVDFAALYRRSSAHNLADAYGLARLAQAIEQDMLDPQIRGKLRVHTERPPRHS